MQITQKELASMVSNITNSILSDINLDASINKFDKNDIQISDEEFTGFHLSQNLFNDATASYFFLRELEYIQRTSRDTKQKALKGMLLIPVSSEAPEWSKSITWRRLTKVGIAKVIADYAHDFPRADVYREEFTIKVKGIGSSYGYNKDEIMSARATGQPLDRERAMSCKRAIDEEQDSIIWNGNSSYNIQGFLGYSGISEYSTPNGVDGSATFASKTPDEILLDLNGIVDTIIDTTNGVESPDTLIMPIAQFRDISTRRLTDNTNETVLSFFLKTNGLIKNVDWVTELSTAGAGSTAQMIAYRKDPNYLRVEIPKMYQEEPPQQKGLEFEIIAEQKTAGVLVYYPLSIAFADGI